MQDIHIHFGLRHGLLFVSRPVHSKWDENGYTPVLPGKESVMLICLKWNKKSRNCKRNKNCKKNKNR